MSIKKVVWLFCIQSFFSLLIVTRVDAAPWVDPGDERLRHHLTVLADSGILNKPITTWPLMWGAVMEDIWKADSVSHAANIQWSLDYVEFAFRQASRSFNTHTYLGWKTDPSIITGFSTDQREEFEFKSELDWVGQNFAVRLRGAWINDAIDGQDARLDGSYLSAIVGNWNFGVGAVDRWWGPGWQNSNILSSNARPVPAIMVQRNFSDAFSWPVFSWLGPWTFTAFVGQLESNREIPSAKLVGARFAFKPLSYLEIGFSRTAQWGGDNRPQDLSSFWDLVAGNDNVGDDGISKENQPGNQLGAIDVRFGGNLLGTQSALYVQYVGEDESNAFPTRGFYLGGIETAFASAQTFHRFYLEYTDTTSGGDNYNTTYEHSVYQSGYRYRGRSLGASIDNDSKMGTLAGFHYFGSGDELNWRLHVLDINHDGTNKANPGGSVFGSDKTETALVELGYATIFHDLKVSTTLSYIADELTAYGKTINGTGFSIAIEYKP